MHTEGIREGGKIEGLPISTYYSPCVGIRNADGYLRVFCDAPGRHLETRVDHALMIEAGWTPPSKPNYQVEYGRQGLRRGSMGRRQGMKAAVFLSRTGRGNISRQILAIANGLMRSGVDVSYFIRKPDMTADFAVCWGWRKGLRLRQAGFTKPILVAERGYLGDRMNVWTSLGWDGLNNRARFPEPQDNGERFWQNHGASVCEWKSYPEGYHLVIGQVLGDMALQNVNFVEWVKETIDALHKQGKDVRFRPHPEAVSRGQTCPVPDYMVLGGTLSEALSEAAAVYTWNSNTGVDAVVSGVPAVTYDEGAMAWDVTSHHVLQELVMPDRNEWFRRMAWKQWRIEEIESGEAWEVVRSAMPCPA